MGRTARRIFKALFGTAAAWTVAVKPRILGKPDLSEIRRYDYARRGLYDPEKGIAENSKEAISAAIAAGYGILLDVRQDDEGVPIISRDDGIFASDENALTLEEALNLIDGQVPVLLELRPEEGYTEELCENTAMILDLYDGVFALQSLNWRALRWFKKERNEYIRGQVVDYGYRSGSDTRSGLRDFLSNSLLLNLFTSRDYISTNINDRNKPSLWLCRLVYRVQRMDWTVRNIDEYEMVKS